MRGTKLLFTVLAIGVTAACGPAEAVVTAAIAVETPEGEEDLRPLAGLEVSLLPYDRDIIFDSLTNAAATPEPPIPDSLQRARELVAEAQEEWRSAEAEWNTLRDTLQTLSDELQTLNRGEGRYVTLFNEFRDMETRLNNVESRMNQAFARFDSLQKGTFEQSEQVRIARENWADEAFTDVGEVIGRRLEASGRESVVDTTNAQGVVTFEAAPGEWWVHARQELPYTELYWNVPITLQRGEPLELRLSRENAEVRPKL